jgi:similar to stage IV sporulation protein
MLDSFRGIVEFRVFTENGEDFLNRLRNSSVSARNLKVSDGVLTGEIYWFDLKTLKKLADKVHAGFEETGRRGFIFKAVKYRRRYGFMIGVFAAAVMVFLLSNITMKINVFGNETMSDNELRAVLEDCGIYIGSYLPNVNLRVAERDMVANVGKIAWAGIKRSGPIVSVEIAEMTEKPEMIPTNMPANVVSTKNAQIVKINSVPMGMLVPMLYDTVKEGELLVTGVIEGKLKNTYYVHAMADIIGRYEERVSFTQKLTDTVLEYSDRYTKRSLLLFGLRIPLFLGGLNLDNTETDEDINYINLFNLEIPIGVINTEITPYTPVSTLYTIEDAKASLEEKIKRYEQNFYLDEGVEIIDKTIVFTETEEDVSVTVKYVLESNICNTEYILVKNHK